MQSQGPRERRDELVTIVLVVLSLAIITFLDVVVYPQHNVTILYAIPVLLGALRASPRAVLTIAISSLVVDGVNALVHHHPLEAWLLRTIVLVGADAFAVLLARQRLALQRQARALADANAQLAELQAERAEWTSLVAHDLRQPITVILGYAGHLVAQTEQRAPELARSAEHIRTSARQMNRLIGDLQAVSRIAAHRFTIQQEQLLLLPLVQAVVEQFAATTPEHPIDLACQGEIPPITGDPERIVEVLRNLLSNAEKYSYPCTAIGVGLARRGESVELSVTNQGTGIPPEEVPSLFTRFYRTAGARAGSVRGTGLGLYISRGIVEAHGGRIWVESVPGQETTFHVALPVPVSDDTAPAA